MSLGDQTLALQTILETKPGAVAVPVPVPRGRPTPAQMYKVMGKVFAILSIRGGQSVILKSDPHLAEVLRELYAGVGHRSHLGRNWISVDLDADVPPEEIERFVDQSYNLVCAGLTRKQKAELAALSS